MPDTDQYFFCIFDTYIFDNYRVDVAQVCYGSTYAVYVGYIFNLMRMFAPNVANAEKQPNLGWVVSLRWVRLTKTYVKKARHQEVGLDTTNLNRHFKSKSTRHTFCSPMSCAFQSLRAPVHILGKFVNLDKRSSNVREFR